MKPRNVAWIVAISFPLLFVPLWVGCWKQAGLDYLGLTTATGGLLLIIVSVAARTDFQSARIPNWVTYTGTVWAFLLNGFHTWVGDETTNHCLGTIGIGQSFLGFATMFFGLLVIFSFSGGGAGDVKLVGTIGAFLGTINAFEAVLLAFVCCSIVSIVQALFRRVVPLASPAKLAAGGNIDAGLGETMKRTALTVSAELMREKIRLGPFFAVGTILVLCRESGLFEFAIIGN